MQKYTTKKSKHKCLSKINLTSNAEVQKQTTIYGEMFSEMKIIFYVLYEIQITLLILTRIYSRTEFCKSANFKDSIKKILFL